MTRKNFLIYSIAIVWLITIIGFSITYYANGEKVETDKSKYLNYIVIQKYQIMGRNYLRLRKPDTWKEPIRVWVSDAVSEEYELGDTIK